MRALAAIRTPNEQRLTSRLLLSASQVDPTSGSPALADVLEHHIPSLVTAAAFHRVTGMLVGAAREELPSQHPLLTDLRQQLSGQIGRQLKMAVDLHSVRAVLKGVGVEMVLIKGLALAHTVFADPAMRPAADLDVLVRPEDLSAAVSALQAAGASLLDRNWDLARSELRGQVHLVLAHGGVVDLHWDLLNRSAVRRSFTVPTNEVVTRSVVASIEGVEVRTLDPVDTVLHLALHGCLSGGHRLGWLVDIDRAVRSLSPDWGVLVERAEQWRARDAVGLMLVRARNLYGTPVPGDASQRLVGALPEATTNFLDRIDPPGGRSRDGGPMQWWMPTMRDRGPEQLSPRLRRQVDLGRALRRRGSAAERSTESILAVGSGSSTLTDYLRDVEALSRT